MMKNSKEHKTALPELRFPEFRESGEWLEEIINNICKSYSGGTPKTTENDYYGGDIPFIRSAEINKESTELYLTEEGLQNSSAKLVNKGDVLVALYGANSGDVAVSKINGAINQAILCLKSKDCNEFLHQYLSLKKEDIISTYIQGGQGNLSGEIIKSLKLLFPTPAEQQKIADCLTSLDDLITAVADKIEALKLHKKGLMQQLFPAEGKTTPALRFPEFKDSGEWVEDKIKNICTSYSGGTPKTTENNYYGGDIPFIRSAEINKESTELYLTEEGLQNSSAKLVNKGDVLVALYGANSGDVAVSKINGAINQAILCLKSKDCNHYLYQYLSLKKEDIISTYIQGGQGNLSGEIIKSLKLLFPTPAEQQKIADCLSSIDEQISAETQKLESLKSHKKGLMQRLFPKI